MSNPAFEVWFAKRLTKLKEEALKNARMRTLFSMLPAELRSAELGQVFADLVKAIAEDAFENGAKWQKEQSVEKST